MVGITQKGKFVSVKTSLGEDVLLLTTFSGEESISRPFRFHLEMLSTDHAIQAKDLVGKKVDVSIVLSDGSERVFNGHIMRFIGGPVNPSGKRIYHAEMVPWFQLLTLSNDCRIFQNMDVKAIIEEVFGSRGFSDFQINTQRTFKTREYTVQYRESDFQFVSRLLEEEGIFYFFSHESGKHTMHIADAANAYVGCDESEAHFYDGGRSGDQLTEWSHEYNMIPGKWAQTDYNFTTPSTDISTTIDSVVDLPDISNYEQYDYPGLYENRGDGDALTKIRIEEEEATHDIVSSSGTYRSFKAGGKFTLATHEISGEQGKEYVITSISHFARDASYELREGGGREYSNNFQCIPASVPYRPQQITRKPYVQGPQTAVVVGPGGEEIYTDEYGRIKVQFHWDRVGKKDENSSCWLRVSQQWAGKQWGAIFLPRIGHEVVVSFLEGDPDRPLVTGCVYNADNMPPYELPANKTQSGWKTRSADGGSSSNFNELRFEDKKGSEEIYIHAEKDQNNVVENDETTSVGHDRTEDIGNDETITIGNNRTETVSKDETISIGNNRTESVGKNETISIVDNRTEDVGKNETINIGENRTVDVGKNETISIGATQGITVGKDNSLDVAKNQAVTVGEKRTTQVGKDDVLDVGKKLTIQAGDQITLKTGKASITMKKDGTITIKGKDIKLDGSGKINVKASKDIIMKGSKIAQN